MGGVIRAAQRSPQDCHSTTMPLGASSKFQKKSKKQAIILKGKNLSISLILKKKAWIRLTYTVDSIQQRHKKETNKTTFLKGTHTMTTEILIIAAAWIGTVLVLNTANKVAKYLLENQKKLSHCDLTCHDHRR